jgi:hypothetical protein
MATKERRHRVTDTGPLCYPPFKALLREALFPTAETLCACDYGLV